MRLTPVALLALTMSPVAAHADEARQPMVTFQGGMSAIGPLDPPDGEVGGPEDVGLQLRGIVSWEVPPLPYKEPRGYNVRGTVVPEIFLGMITAGDDRTELLGTGLRLELAFAQRRMGLLQVSARGGIYVAARGGLFTDPDRTPFLEGAFGEYLRLGATARVGFELGVMGIYAKEPDIDDGPWVIRGALAGPPFDQGRGTYLNVDAAVYVSTAL